MRCRILLFLKWIANKDLLYNTWNSAQCYAAAWMGGELGGEWICISVCVYIYIYLKWLSPLAVHLKLSQHCLLTGWWWKEPACQCRRLGICGFDPWVRKSPWSRKWQPLPAFLPGKSHGKRNLADYSSLDSKESNTAKHSTVPPVQNKKLFFFF